MFFKPGLFCIILIIPLVLVPGFTGNSNRIIVKAHDRSRIIHLEEDERIYIEKQNPFTFSEVDWKPMSIVDVPGKYDGIIADYLQLISEKTGMEFEFIPAKIWPDVLSLFRNREIDLIPALTPEDIAGRDILLTDEYITFPLVIVTTDRISFIRDTSELNGKKVAAGKNFTSAEYLKRNFPSIRLVETATVEEGLILLSNGEVDAFVDHMAICIEYMRKLGIRNLKIGGMTRFTFHHRIGIDPRHALAASIINRAISSITEDEHRRIYSKWINVSLEKPFDYLLAWEIAVSAFILFLLAVTWNRKLSRFNNKLNSEISERKKAEERLSVALDASGIGLWENRLDTGESFFSDRMFMMLGYDPLPPEQWKDFFSSMVHPEDAARLEGEIREYILSGGSGLYKTEFRLKNSHGYYNSILSVGKALETDSSGRTLRMVGVHIDVSDFRIAEAAARGSEEKLKKLVDELRMANEKIRLEMEERSASEKRFRDIADLLPQMIYECDVDGNITYTNRFGFGFTGYTEDDLGRVNFRQFLSGDDLRSALDNLKFALETGGVTRNEYHFVQRDGTVVPVLIYSSVISRDGVFSGMRGIVIDISELKMVEEALIAANRAKSEFLANVSHEIRTPMNAIMGLANIVLGGNLEPGQRKYIDKINSSALALLQIINDMLDYSKIEANKLELEEIEFRLEDVLVNLSELLSFSADEHEMEILMDVEPGVPCFYLGDPLRLGQVLVNLTSNAIKFGANRDVLINVSKAREEGLDRRFVALSFSVTDRGIGMTEDQISKLFRPFTQADSSITRRFGGTGLGLVICKQIADLMKGSITIQSVPGEGSVFTFTARLLLADKISPDEDGIRCDYSGVKVLVVDDSEVSCRIIRSSLMSINAECDTITDPAAAAGTISFAVKEGRPYHVVMVDFRMPGMDGIECIENIRSECGRDILCILMTSPYGRDSIEKRAEDAGVNMFLDRPVFASSLRNSLNEILKFEKSVTYEDTHPARGDSPKNRDLEELRKMSGIRMLIVEDNRTNQMVISALAEKAGIKTSFAENGAICLDSVENNKYDIILMDIQMPVMDGYEASRELRRRGVDVPIIGVSAHAFTGERDNCINAGMNDYISKPVSLPELYKKILAFLSGSA